VGFINNTDQRICFGLAQPIRINGRGVISPLAIIAGPANQNSFLKPLPQVKIFLATNLTSSQIQPLSILRAPTALPSKARTPGHQAHPLPPFTIGSYLEVDLTSNSTLRFDPIHNCFIQALP